MLAYFCSILSVWVCACGFFPLLVLPELFLNSPESRGSNAPLPSCPIRLCKHNQTFKYKKNGLMKSYRTDWRFTKVPKFGRFQQQGDFVLTNRLRFRWKCMKKFTQSQQRRRKYSIVFTDHIIWWCKSKKGKRKCFFKAFAYF